jgi:hypothetical protein
VSLLELHSCIPYFSIAPFIGMEATSKYSVSIDCPYCSAHSFAIHQDNRNLEEWYYCYQCKATGSVIAMAAERLGMEETEAIRYLADQLEQSISDKVISSYYKSCDFKNKYLKFWDYASKRTATPSNAQRHYLAKLGWQIRSPMSTERLATGPAKLYGLADPKAAQKYLGKRFLAKEPLVIVPFYRTPSVISGFSCLSPSRTSNTNPQSSGQGANAMAKGEPGFAGLQFLPEFQSEIVVATSMLQNMVRLQMHHFSSNITPLPLLSWHQQVVQSVQKQWSVLSDRQLVIWENQPTAAILHQAMMCDAHIAFVGPGRGSKKVYQTTGDQWRKWVRHDPAIDTWRRVVKNAKPYEQALKTWVRSANAQEKVRLLQDAEQYDEHTAELVRSAIRPKLASKIGKRIRVGNHSRGSHAGQSQSYAVIIERGDKWYDLNGKIVFPGTVRVTHIVVRPGGEQEYAGYLKVGDSKFDFHVPKKSATNRWLKDFGLNSGVLLQEDFYVNTYRNRKSNKFNFFEAAIQFQEPEIVNGLSKVGWDGAGFQFKSSRLVNGTFIQNPDFKLPLDAPGPKQNFCLLNENVKTALQKDCKEMEVVWALATALCAQITAPVVDMQPYGVWIKRKKHDPFMQALYYRFAISKGSYDDWPHRWPRRLDSVIATTKRDMTGFFVVRYMQNPSSQMQDIVTVDADDDELQPRLVTHSADKILLNYLREFSKQEPEHPNSWESWVGQTHNKLKEVFSFVDTRAFEEAKNRLSVS